jgi:hypothetical protein
MDRFHWSSIAKETRVDWTNCWYSITVYSVDCWPAEEVKESRLKIVNITQSGPA